MENLKVADIKKSINSEKKEVIYTFVIKKTCNLNYIDIKTIIYG